MFQLIGKQKMDYISKKTGQQIKGYKLYYTYTSKSVDGLCCDNCFVSEDMGHDVEINQYFDIFYNKFGKVVKLIRKID